MKILLIGGTGAIGIPLSNILSLRGDDVYVTSRHYRQNKDRITFLKINGHDIAQLDSVMSDNNWDVVVDFLIYGSNEFPEHVSKIISKTKQYIFISSARVFAECHGSITESSHRLLDYSNDKEYLKTDEYAIRKARCENWLRQYSNYTIVRPSITFYENRLQLGVYEIENWLTRIVKGMPIVLSKDIMSKITTLTYSGDVAKAIAGLCGNPESYQEDYNVVTSEFLTWEDVTELYLDTLKELGYIPKIKLIDKTLNLKVAALKYQVLYARLFNRQFDNTKILRLLPNLKFSNTKEELKRCIIENISKYEHNTILSITNILQDRTCNYILPKSEVGSIIRYIKYLIVRFIPEKILLKIM